MRLSFQIDPAADAARIDKVQIQQVVVNFVRNGIEAMEGAADKSLALGTSPAANGMVEVWVSDRGAGLSEAAASTLFEPFRSTKPGGMGIGLSISGRSSKPMEGGSGQISILSAARSSASRYPACMPRRVAMSEPRVHLIDDEDSVRNAMSFILDMADLPSRSYASALEFLDVAGSIREGCVVTDLRMPHMSGLELITRMKQLGLGLPVVMISGHGDIPIAVEAMRAGVVDFIEKPFKKDALLDAIRRALDSEASRAAAQSSRRRFEEMIATLSPRQTDVLRGVIAGKMNKTIANELGISIRTVEVHRAHVMSKTHAASLSELVRIAMSAGF